MDSESSHIRVDPDMTLHTHPVCSHRARQTTLSLHRHVSSLNGVLSPATSTHTSTRNYQPGPAHRSVPSVDISRPGHNQHSARASIAHQKLKGEVYPLPQQTANHISGRISGHYSKTSTSDNSTHSKHQGIATTFTQAHANIGKHFRGNENLGLAIAIASNCQPQLPEAEAGPGPDFLEGLSHERAYQE